MDLNSPVVAPVVEPTGARAVFGMVAGGIVGAAVALPVLIGVFGV